MFFVIVSATGDSCNEIWEYFRVNLFEAEKILPVLLLYSPFCRKFDSVETIFCFVGRPFLKFRNGLTESPHSHFILETCRPNFYSSFVRLMPLYWGYMSTNSRKTANTVLASVEVFKGIFLVIYYLQIL